MSGKKKHRTADEFLHYLRGEHSNQERHSFERGMETDPFEKEALEGLEGLTPAEAETDILSLHARLRKRLARRRRIAIYSAAATVASLLIIGTIFVQIYDISPRSGQESLPEKEIPMNAPDQEEVKEPQAEAAADEFEAPKVVPEVSTGRSIESKGVSEETKGGSEGSKGVPGEIQGDLDRTVAGTEVLLEDEAEFHAVTEGFQAESEDFQAETEEFQAGTEDLQAEAGAKKEVVQPFAYEADSKQETAKMDREIVAVEAAPEVRRGDKSRPQRIRREKKVARPMVATNEEIEAFEAGQVSGVVVSAEDMQPLPGARVVVKGRDTGVVADMQGQFLLPAEEDSHTTLIASFIGMETSEYPVTAGSEVELVMKPDMANLDEVVVIGYPETGITEFDKSATRAEPSPGYKVFKQYIQENIKFPDSDEATTRAVVILKFTITAGGEIMAINSLRSPGLEFTNEAVRLLNEGPSWNAATNESGAADEEVRLRIVFKK